MHRSPLELDVHIRHRLESFAAECRAAETANAAARSSRSRSRLRRNAGLWLIRAGEALAGPDPARPLRPVAAGAGVLMRSGS